MNELIIKKCNKCGAIVRVLKDCSCNDCGIKCCGEEMNELKVNSVDASFEKHIPTYELEGNMLNITVNHVMDDDHFIEWISIISDNEEETIYFKPGEKATASIKYIKGSKIYSYCNKHGLWMTEVE